MENETGKRTRREASEYLWKKHRVRASPATLAKKATAGTGPAYRYSGKFTQYEDPDLDAYAAEQLSGKVRSTAGNPHPPKPRRQPMRTATPLGRLYP
jgi:hypothetical protein